MRFDGESTSVANPHKGFALDIPAAVRLIRDYALSGPRNEKVAPGQCNTKKIASSINIANFLSMYRR